MEILLLVLVWVLLLYFIRLHREISFYKRVVNQHKDIYVPTLPEILETSGPGRQLLASIQEYMGLSVAAFKQKLNTVYRRNEEAELPIMIMQPSHEKELKF